MGRRKQGGQADLGRRSVIPPAFISLPARPAGNSHASSTCGSWPGAAKTPARCWPLPARLVAARLLSSRRPEASSPLAAVLSLWSRPPLPPSAHCCPPAEEQELSVSPTVAEPVSEQPPVSPELGEETEAGLSAEAVPESAVEEPAQESGELALPLALRSEEEEARPEPLLDNAREAAAAAEGAITAAPGRIRGKRGLAGIDIGSSSVKIVLAERDSSGIVIWDFSQWTLSQGIMGEGWVRDPLALASALRSARVALSGRRCVGAVSGQKTVLRQMEFPRMSRRELEAALQLQRDQYLPLPWPEAQVDFAILGESPEGKMQVLLAAAPSAVAHALARALEEAGWRPLALESDSLALARAFHLAVVPEEAGSVTIGVQLGAEFTLVFASREGIPLLSRAIPLGGGHLTRELARALDLDEAAAERYKRARGLEIPELWPVSERLAVEITKTVEYCLDHGCAAYSPRVYLTGGGAHLQGFGELLRGYLEGTLRRRGKLPSQAGWLTVAGLDSARVRVASRSAAWGPEYFLALGLALRGGSR